MERAIVLEQVAAWFGARSRDQRERAAVREGGYWICGGVSTYFLVWLLFFGILSLNVKELLLQHIGN
jgi:hypothetical protein